MRQTVQGSIHFICVPCLGRLALLGLLCRLGDEAEGNQDTSSGTLTRPLLCDWNPAPSVRPYFQGSGAPDEASWALCPWAPAVGQQPPGLFCLCTTP